MEQLTELNLEEIRERLENEHQRLLGQMNAGNGNDDRSFGYNPDRSDLAGDYFARDRQAALQSVEGKMLQQIEGALQRMDEGTYGLCQNCGNPIDPERLEALPYATLCMDCTRQSSKRT